jgi:NAD(P)-dependent dehydrogenase (short-subunit alcohol dehydrogenase family)
VGNGKKEDSHEASNRNHRGIERIRRTGSARISQSRPYGVCQHARVQRTERAASRRGKEVCGRQYLRTIELEVASQESVDAAVQRIVSENGHLDVVIHNAGHMVFGPAEAFTPEQLAELYDINVLSTQRVNRATLPVLRKQSKGLVVWVGSTRTRGGTPPYLAPYLPPKLAWMLSPSAMPGNLRAGTSKLR